MIASVEMPKNQEKSRNEFASHFLKSTVDTKRLQATLTGLLPFGEVLRLALLERELHLRQH